MAHQERMDRLTKVLEEVNQIVRDVYPKLIRYAHLRKESDQIIEELKRDEQRD